MREDGSVEKLLAQRLARLREEHRWSLDELAGRTTLSQSTLSRLERGEISPTATQLNQIAGAYGRSMSRLLAEVEGEPPQLIRAKEQVVWTDASAGFARRSVSPPHPGLRVEVIKGLLTPGADISYDTAPVPEMEQHLWVLEGTLDVTLQTDWHRLEQGDCLRFRLWGPSRFECRGPRETRYVVVIVPS